MLYSLFRQQWTESGKPLLAFPSGGARGSQIRNPGAFLNGLAAPQFSAIDYAAWARWQVRLGWGARAWEGRPGVGPRWGGFVMGMGGNDAVAQVEDIAVGARPVLRLQGGADDAVGEMPGA